MMTSSTPKGGTLPYPGVGYPDVPESNCRAAGDAHRVGARRRLAVTQDLNESLGFFPTRQQAGGAHLVQGGRGGVAVGDQQLVLTGPIDRQRRVGGGDGVLALRAVLG